jgi:hypothetical protein
MHDGKGAHDRQERQQDLVQDIEKWRRAQHVIRHDRFVPLKNRIVGRFLGQFVGRADQQQGDQGLEQADRCRNTVLVVDQARPVDQRVDDVAGPVDQRLYRLKTWSKPR